MSDIETATIAGKPVEWWEGVMDEIQRNPVYGAGDIAGITVSDDCSFRVTDGHMPNDFRGIRADGTRIESQQLVRSGIYGPYPGKWGKPA